MKHVITLLVNSKLQGNFSLEQISKKLKMASFPSPLRQGGESPPPSYEAFATNGHILPVIPSSDLPTPRNKVDVAPDNNPPPISTQIDNFQTTTHNHDNSNIPRVTRTRHRPYIQPKKCMTRLGTWFKKHPRIKFFTQFFILFALIGLIITVVEVSAARECGFGYSIKDCNLGR